MNQEDFLKLTMATYKVTEMFPENEPLRIAIRKKSIQVFSVLTLIRSKYCSNKKELCKDGIKEAELLSNYFRLSSVQNWVDEKNFEVLLREYDKVKKVIEIESLASEFEKTPARAKKENPKQEKEPVKNQKERKIDISNLPEHQKKIVEEIKRNGKMKSSDISRTLSQISSRSIRRGLKDLKEKKIIRAGGTGKLTFYQMATTLA